MSRFSLIAVVLALLAATIGAGIYKWVDEKGVTQYSEEPPAARKAEEIKVAPGAPAAREQPAPASKTWQQQEEEFQRRRLEREAAERKLAEDEAAAREQVRARKGRCIMAQQNLHVLLTQRPVYRLDEKGERVFVEDLERSAAIARAKKEIELYCPPQK